ncbi:MAG: hypothetical protein AAFR98_12090 [Pseudomonadota bacterium]
MKSIKVIFEDGREEVLSDEHRSGVLYGITRLEQTPIISLLGIKMITEESGEVLWPASEILKGRAIPDS